MGQKQGGEFCAQGVPRHQLALDVGWNSPHPSFEEIKRSTDQPGVEFDRLALCALGSITPGLIGPAIAFGMLQVVLTALSPRAQPKKWNLSGSSLRKSAAESQQEMLHGGWNVDVLAHAAPELLSPQTSPNHGLCFESLV